MKTYSFAKLQARPYPTLSEIANPYIYGDVRCVINVSEKAYPTEIVAAFRQKGISFFHYPLREEDGEMDIQNIRMAVMQLDKADREGWRSVVHCDFGNNRSRVVAELFHYYKKGFLLEDEYKGFHSHVEYNIASGHLSPDMLIYFIFQRSPADDEYLNEFHKKWNEDCMRENEIMQSMHYSAEYLRAQSRRLEEMVQKEEAEIREQRRMEREKKRARE